jgi:hypothetical protein
VLGGNLDVGETQEEADEIEEGEFDEDEEQRGKMEE